MQFSHEIVKWAKNSSGFVFVIIEIVRGLTE